ncbi:MAG: adenylate kinase [Sinobacteraceae bacterium]|nr:adenylate kinase [Nevskiaceae bacterium]
MHIVLLGAPGSGKGTQSQRLAERHGIPQISTGDLLRAARAKGSPLGLKAKEAMDKGKLVDDSIVLGMIRERLADPDVKNGFILDGFPRNLAQARALNALLKELGQPLDAVVQMDVDYGELIRRISGRRTCADCRRVFNVFTTRPELIELEKCPVTGEAHKLFQRQDDTEETVTQRLKVYEEETKPLIEFYQKRRLLQSINAEGHVDEVTKRLESALQAAEGNRAAVEEATAQAEAEEAAAAEAARVAAAEEARAAEEAAAKGARAAAAAKRRAAAKGGARRGKVAVTGAKTGKRVSGKKAAAGVDAKATASRGRSSAAGRSAAGGRAGSSGKSSGARGKLTASGRAAARGKVASAGKSKRAAVRRAPGKKLAQRGAKRGARVAAVGKRAGRKATGRR